MKLDGWAWAVFFARWILGLIFLMAGYWKVFVLGPGQHAQRYFIDGFSETWIPVWLLWTLGVSIPVLELVAGGLVCLGFRLRESLPVLGTILVIVTYGHLLLEPLYDLTGHVIPRLLLLLVVLMVPRDRDVLSIDYWLGRGSTGS